MSASPNFRRAFELTPGSRLLLAPDLRIVAVSDAYARAAKAERDALVGRPLAAVLEDDPDAAGARDLTASLERVLATKRPDRVDLPGRRAALNVPIVDDDGAVEHIVHCVEDAPDHARLPGGDTRSPDEYRQLLDSSPDAIVVVDRSGRMILVNREAETLFGYARAELIGQPVAMLVPDDRRDRHAAHEASFFADPAPRPMGSRLDLHGRRKDGSVFPIEVRLSPLGTGERMTVSAAIRDVSDRRRMEAEAKRTADLLVSAVESIQDAFAVFDHEDRLVLCNSVYRRLIGDALPGPIVGRKYGELLDAWMSEIAFTSETARTHFRTERLARRREPTSSFDLRLRDGRSLRVVDRRTAEGGIVKTIWDLTEDVRLAEELRLARGAAEAASTAKSEFLSSMSHELRTPLNAILGFAQLLQRDRKEPLSERHKERAAQILRGGEHLLRLIDDVLDLSRIEAQGISVSIEPVSVAEVLTEVETALEPLAARLGVALSIEPLPDAVPMIAADRTRFAQILMNFGSNAIKYNRPEGSARFVVGGGPDGFVRVAVHDTGMGVPLDKQDKLFQPFQRAGQETGPIEGTGIGLVITQRLARLMGGDTGFRSAPGAGSTFWVDLPVHASARTPAMAPAKTDKAPSLAAGGVRRVVLYVEDNPANVTFMKDLLGSLEDVDCLTAPTAEIGVEIARARRPDAVIMDINLPGMSGIDALRALRGAPETRDIPVIALSAAASERDKQRGVAAGFFEYLTKPVKVDELLSVLERALAASPPPVP